MANKITETVNGVSYDYSPITEEAGCLVFGDRQADYNHPADDFSRTAGLWTAYMGVAFTPEDVAMLMCMVKISRQRNRAKRDNLTDLAGYAECCQRVIEARSAGVPITDWTWVASSVEEFQDKAEELDRINDLVPPGVSVEDLVACWEAHHTAEGWTDETAAECTAEFERLDKLTTTGAAAQAWNNHWLDIAQATAEWLGG